jgi:hypothetical protein
MAALFIEVLMSEEAGRFGRVNGPRLCGIGALGLRLCALGLRKRLRRELQRCWRVVVFVPDGVVGPIGSVQMGMENIQDKMEEKRIFSL